MERERQQETQFRKIYVKFGQNRLVKDKVGDGSGEEL